MPVKRYEVDGNPYDVSDAKEQEFLSKFSNAVLIGVLDEEGVVVEQEIKDETQDFPISAAADADVVQPMTASQAGATELPSEDTSSDLPKTEEELKLDDIDKTLNKAGTSIWNYSPDNISNLYLKTTGKGVEYQTINTPSILGLGGPEVKYTGIFGDHSSVLTGKFSYDDFAQNEKINGISIAELQAEDQSRAANNALNSIVKKHGDKSSKFVLDQGGNILKGSDKELKTLYSSLSKVSDKDKQSVLDRIQEIRDDESRELYNINTGDLIKYKDLSEEDKKQEDSRSEKASEIAQTTELSKIEDQLTKSYSNLVGISNRISDFVKDNGEEEITRDSQTNPAVLTNVIKDFFGSEETVYGDLERVQQIALTNELPENISKINGDHPLAKAYNTALEKYVVLNKAIQTNTDPLSEEKEGFLGSAGQAILEKIDMTGGDAMPKFQYAVNRAFVKEAKKAGLGGVSDEYLDEALSQNISSVIGGGTVDLTMLVGELMFFKSAGGNKIQKGFKLVDKAFKASKAAKSSKVLRKAGDFVIKGLDEAAVFTGLETTKSTLGLSQQATREQEWATATFAFSLGAGNSLGSGLLRAIPSKTIFSPVMAQLSKSDILKDVGSRFVNASAGAFSFEFATALEAIQNPEGEGYGPRGESTYFEQSPEEFILHYLGEIAKMALLGAKSMFSKNGIYAAAQRDMRLLNLNPAYVNKAAKRTGIDAESVRKPGEETINEIEVARAEKMAGIDAKLKTQQITEEQAKKEAESANKDYNILEAEAELNLAKERFEAEDKSALKPTDESVRILIQKMKKGEKFNDKDNNALVNTPLPVIYARMGMSPSSKSLDGLWNREFVIEDILNNNTSFKAGYGTKERAESYKFINEYFEVGGKIKALEKINNKNQGQEKELESLTKDLEAYNPGGYKYDKLQDKLDQYYLKQRQQNKAQAEDVLGATKEGESVSIRSVDDFQKKYEEVFDGKEDVKETDGFYDPNNKVYYVNEAVVKKTRNITVDKHETGHFVLRDSFKDKTGNVTEEGIKLIDDVLNELTPKQKELVQKRIDDNYRYDSKGKELDASKYYEEYLTVLSDAITEKSIVFKENVGNAMEKFVPFLRKKGMPELELNADTGKNLFELIKSYSKGEEKGIQAAKDISIAAEGVQVEGQKPLKSLSRQGSEKVNKIYKDQGLAGAMDVLELLRPTAVGLARRFEKRPQYDERLVVDEIMTGKRGMLDVIMSYDKKVQSGEDVGPLSGYINNSFSTKTGFKRYIENVEKVVGKEFTEDVSEAKGVKAEEVTIDTRDKPAKKISPKKLKNYTGIVASNLGVSGSEVANTIDKAIEADLKTKPIKTFGESRNIGANLAKTLGKAFGLNPEVFTKKTRNIQKKELDGLRNLRQFLDNNAAKDFSLLPDAYAGPSTIEGKSTFIPNNILNALYRKNDKGKWEKDPTKTVQDYKDLLGKIDGSVYRAAEAQTIKGLAAMSFRNLIVEKAAETAEPKARVDIKAGAKFQRKGIGKKVDENVEKAGARVLTKSVEDNIIFRNYILDRITGLLGKDVNSIIKPGDVAGAGNSAVGSKKSSGALGRGFRFIGNKLRTNRFIPETEKALKERTVMDLEVLRKEVDQKPQILTPEQVKDVRAATSSQTRASMKKNEVNKDAIKRGRNLILNKLFETVKQDINNLGPVRELLYNQNANTSFGRKFATVKSIEDNLKDKEKTWEEHVLQFGNWANRTIQAFGSKDKNILDGWLKWADENYYQEVTGRETQSIVDGSYKGWKAKFEEHPYLKQKLDEAFKTGDFSKVPSSDIRKYNEFFTLNPNNRGRDGVTDAKRYNVEVESKFKNNKNVITEQGKLIYKQFTGEITPKQAKGLINEYVKLADAITKTALVNNENTPKIFKFSKKVSNKESLENLSKIDKALSIARNLKSPVKKIRVFDFDDTLARTKSNVLYTMPNTEGGFSEGSTKLKAIFMVGGPGAGKTNVGKGLKLGRRGYKVVNQDIALEAMKAESGLPANESDYTAEQRSMRSKLGSAARKAAIAKFDKYAANGDGMVIDGTGASYNATTKKIKALQEKGYEVHMVVANTPLETALERNRARKERSLKDFIVEKTYNQVQESLAKYREDFGDRLYEINTKAIEYGKPLPNDFLKVVYEGINANKVGKIDAATFAKEAGNMEAEGAQWDFSEFSKVMEGSKGPLFEVAKSISESPGERDMFVLTARPADAAGPIKEFLDSMGLNIPLENITGLGDGTPQAKARWMIDKAADGYNDFYFADDHLGNVKAVKDILSVVDVKSKVQQAKFSKKLGKTFNDIIQEKTGIASEKTFGAAKAEIVGKGKGKFDIFISPTAEDFAGLLYKTLPKGKKGEDALKFYKENLFDPFARAEDNIVRDQIALANDVRALKNRLGIIPKKLRKKNETGFTNEQALRVRMWTKMGLEVPGLSKSDITELNKVIKDNPTYEAFANELLSTTKGDGWAEPGEKWLSGTLTSDARMLLGKVKRDKYLEQWKQNKDEIFSKANLNKLEAAYGKKYREALEKTLERMQSGKNRNSKNTAGDRALDYINNSVGAIMFLNTRSAVLQTLSSINFINWTDNNPLKAGARLVDAKQYSKDFLEIMNSDYLTARRDGLKLNVSEAEIAADTGARGIINTILKKGFVFTKYADSFAIASGGATFYRNRINTYKKQGLSEMEAKEKAFLDFKEISEQSQQSSRTDKISQQQASDLGRVILAFANTPMQYARLQKKAILDLANKRGDWREHTSKIVYYGFVQNLIFNAIQNALFGLAFADDEQDERLLSKSGRVANGMADSLLRGTGIPGAVVASVKNALMVINNESGKKNPQYSKAIKEIVNLSPTIGNKYRKIAKALKSAEYGAFDNMEFSLDSPAYMAIANVISATTNIPVDRALIKAQNIEGALNEDYENWERVSMGAGFQDWELGIEKKKKSKKSKKLVKRKQTFKTRKFKTRKFN